ncbi:DNA topoisomerase, type IA, core isoform X2 [Tasmannia lanceolata]|uniref:DNA topoisomerase, type IA, core isoform X2 n=1 Tax=Tasmannia lanceolata TaxID=3420 RepID=UPI004063DEB3
MAPKVLMVAEKPSIALSIASELSSGRMSTRRGSTDVHEFDGTFRGFHAHYKVTSVIGHVFSVDFPPTYQNWEVIDPMDLFEAPILKTESNPKAHICRHLSQEASSCGYLVLWLDCDREGENICFEVIECTGFHKIDAGRRIYRARFSSVTEKDILKAMDNLVEPNRHEALAVDARQEIDLKVGVAFTRFQTRYFQGKYGNLDARVISYGPCQTPTLGFCVQRYLQITAFKPEKFWSLHPCIVKNGYELQLEWYRDKVFDFDVAVMFQKLVDEDGTLIVTDVSAKEECKGRPSGLNTVNLLKVASSALGFGPQVAMQIAERLYTQGFISYPRTESTAYPASFDFRSTLEQQLNNPVWADDVRTLLTDGFQKPRSGTDAGDHPPITPMRSATVDVLGNDAWRLYQYITQHFIGTVSPDCKYIRTKIEFSAGGELFSCVGQHVVAKGFTSIMPWMAVNEKNLPQFTTGERVKFLKVDLFEGTTSPPDYLSESELISLMEKNGIGTDASIPVHINNICERNFVQIDNMDALFEAQFSPLADSGRLLSKCGKCVRYMKYISSQPSRLYCGTCEEVYSLPQKGTIKLYKELVCPLDNFELLLFSLAGPEGKSFPLCPYCYNSPPFEGTDVLFGALKLGSSNKSGKGIGMPCFLCPHPTCKHSVIAQGVCACPECNGTLVLDPVSAPKWRLYCNMCNCLVFLPQGAHRISTTRDHCPECDSTIIEVDFNKKTTPLNDGATLHVGCILCDELLHSLVEMKHGKSLFRRSGGRGRGRGRGRGGRGRGRRGGGKREDPRMSFRDF